MTPLPPHNRKDDLLKVAARLFAERGYHGTRINDIADQVGIHKATMYHHYASKASILYEIYTRALDDTMRLLDAIDPAISAQQALLGYLSSALDLVERNPDQSTVYFQESLYLSRWLDQDLVKRIREREAGLLSRVEGIVERGIRSGEFIRCDARGFAHLYLTVTSGAIRLQRTVEGSVVHAGVGNMMALMVNGLLAGRFDAEEHCSTSPALLGRDEQQ